MVTIRNSGRLAAGTAGPGMGLLNLKGRLGLHYHGRAHFMLAQSAAEEETATLVILLIS